MADQPQGLDENAKRALEAGKEAKAKSLEEFAARTKGKPTPTQEENDRAALGEHIAQHEADGGDPDPGGMPLEHRRAMEAGTAGGYQTRQATAQPPRTPPRPPSS